MTDSREPFKFVRHLQIILITKHPKDSKSVSVSTQMNYFLIRNSLYRHRNNNCTSSPILPSKLNHPSNCLRFYNSISRQGWVTHAREKNIKTKVCRLFADDQPTFSVGTIIIKRRRRKRNIEKVFDQQQQSIAHQDLFADTSTACLLSYCSGEKKAECRLWLGETAQKIWDTEQSVPSLFLSRFDPIHTCFDPTCKKKMNKDVRQREDSLYFVSPR